MTDTTPQVEVTAVEAPPDPSANEVLGDAAVAAAALSGAAAATAQHADADAQAAAAQAQAAQATAAAAAASAVDEARVKQLIDEGISKSNAELATALAKVSQPAPVSVGDAPAPEPVTPDQPPKSLDKPKRKTMAERYAGGA